MIPRDVLALPLLPGDKAMMMSGLPRQAATLPVPLLFSSEAMIVPGCLASRILLRSRCPPATFAGDRALHCTHIAVLRPVLSSGLSVIFSARALMRASHRIQSPRASFISKKFCKIKIITLLFVFNKYCPIMDYLGLKDSSRQFRPNCVISFYFHLYLIFHAYV